MNELMRSNSIDCLKLSNLLKNAAEHARIASDHISNGEIPRYSVHLFALLGRINESEVIIKNLAKIHANKSAPELNE